MGQQQAAAVLGGDVGHRKVLQAQRLAQQREGVDHPARLVGARHAHHHIGHECKAAPGRDGGRHEAAPPLVVEGQQLAAAPGHLRRELPALVIVRWLGRLYLETHDRRLFGAPQREQGCRFRAARAQGGRHGAVLGQAQRIEHQQRHALLHLVGQPLPHAFGPHLGHRAAEPAHHAGIAVARHAFGQGLAHIGVVGDVAHVVQGHFQEAVRRCAVDGRIVGTVVENQHPARHRLHLAYAQGLQPGIGNPGMMPSCAMRRAVSRVASRSCGAT